MALEDTNRLAGDCRVKLDFFFSSVTDLRPSSSHPLSSTLRDFTISLPGETPPPATKMCWNSTSKVQHSQLKS